MIIRGLFTFLFVLFFTSTAIGQSFSLLEMIKMVKMDEGSFDTFVSEKGYVFYFRDDKTSKKILTYMYNPSPINTSEAENFITLYNYEDLFLKSVDFTTRKTKEYLKIKNQLKTLDFKFIESRGGESSDGNAYTFFLYKKGKCEVSIYAWKSVYEVNVGIYKN